MVKVSVLMPVYKTNEIYLKEAIESVLGQTFSDFEFLILDDCPTDDRESIVKSYNDKRIKYFKNEKNLGITPSRNKLIDMAKGEYLAVFDHDDICLPERFAKQVEYLDNHPNVGVVGCVIKLMSNGKLSRNPTNSDDIKRSLMSVCAVTHPASMIRKSVLMDNNIRYEEKFSPAEDYALWCRLIPYTEFHNLEDVLFLYRDHENNTSHNQRDKMRDADRAIVAFAQIENPVIYNEFLWFAESVNKIMLFGFIPLITIRKRANKTKVYLFEKILIYKSKFTRKLQIKR
ncbi:MAG: glycosyltransferase family 2 protein [Alphaproteobacteria bacterium]|nr:glycosyltransferase family 2 protein [Alphaproteobacteria bacterium]